MDGMRTLPGRTKPAPYFLWDVHNIAYRCYFAAQAFSKPVVNSKGKDVGHLVFLFKSIHSAIKKYGNVNEKPILYFADDKNRPDAIALDPLYKANRREKTDAEKTMIEDCRNLVKLLPSTYCWQEGEEADNIIATLAFKLQGKKFIFSSDKDMWQLLSSIRDLTIVRTEPVTEAEMQDKFSVGFADAHKIILAKALLGDASDNIPKVPRLQWAKVVEALYLKSTGTLESFKQIIESSTDPKVVKERERIEKAQYEGSNVHGWERIELNYKLAKLNTKADFQTQKIEKNKEALVKFLEEHEMPSCVTVVPDLLFAVS